MYAELSIRLIGSHAPTHYFSARDLFSLSWASLNYFRLPPLGGRDIQTYSSTVYEVFKGELAAKEYCERWLLANLLVIEEREESLAGGTGFYTPAGIADLLHRAMLSYCRDDDLFVLRASCCLTSRERLASRSRGLGNFRLT
jgi:hypothetical protein